MTLSALITVALIYLSPCTIDSPPGVGCRDYRIHLEAERAYLDSWKTETEKQGE